MGLPVSREILGDDGVEQLIAHAYQQSKAYAPEVTRNPDNPYQSLHERVAGEAMSLAVIPREEIRSIAPQFPEQLPPEVMHPVTTIHDLFLLPGRGQPSQAKMVETARISGQLPPAGAPRRSVNEDPRRGLGGRDQLRAGHRTGGDGR